MFAIATCGEARNKFTRRLCFKEPRMLEIYLTLLVLAVYDIYLMQPPGVNYLCREGHGEPGSQGVSGLSLQAARSCSPLSPLVEPALQ